MQDSDIIVSSRPDTQDVKLKKTYFTGFSKEWKEKVQQKYNNFCAFGAT